MGGHFSERDYSVEYTRAAAQKKAGEALDWERDYAYYAISSPRTARVNARSASRAHADAAGLWRSIGNSEMAEIHAGAAERFALIGQEVPRG